MPRSRNIKPGLFKNETLAECNIFARYLFEGLWCEADRDGRLEDRPKRLKIEYLPYDDVDVEDLLWQLAEKGFIKRYVAKGCNYVWIPNFEKHQRPHKKEESRNHPEYNGQDRENPRLAGNSSLPAALIADCLIADGADVPECLNADDLPTEDSAETGDAGQSAANDPPVEEFQVDGSTKIWKLRQSRFENYVKLYPHLDVPLEIAKAKQWIIDNPTKRKTAGGMLAFLTRWMSRAQNAPRAGPMAGVGEVRPGVDPSIWSGNE